MRTTHGLADALCSPIQQNGTSRTGTFHTLPFLFNGSHTYIDELYTLWYRDTYIFEQDITPNLYMKYQ
jgi:hypothetical protein